MLIKWDDSVMLGGMKAHRRTGAEFKGVFRRWMTKWKIILYRQEQKRNE